jgi:hypothetical protein
MTKGPGRGAGWQVPDIPLIAQFDPVLSFLRNDQIEFVDAAGKWVEVDDSQELLLLGFAAMREIGGGSALPSEDEWTKIEASTRRVISQASEHFNWDAYASRSGKRLERLSWRTTTDGSLQIMILHDQLLRVASESHLSGVPVSTLWCMLCLLWVDRCVYYLGDGDVVEAVHAALRAAGAFNEGLPQRTLADARRELASRAGKRRSELHPSHGRRQQAFEIWKARRADFAVKADLVRYIQDKVPDLINFDVVSRWTRQWEREFPDTDPAS